MTAKKTASQIISEARKYQKQRDAGYREQALKLYPWICGRCEREFDHKNLRELTVHHRNHDHDDNPSDGGNWELLCLYCHDNEHQRFEENHGYAPDAPKQEQTNYATQNPFANLKDLLKK